MYITRSLGLDIGDRWIGVAISDPGGSLARPLIVINCRDDTADVAAITDIISQQRVQKVIVGLPRLMDGSLGEQAEKVKAFARRLSRRTEVPVEFRDERLTTVLAKRLMREAITRKPGGKARHDAVVAALILQGYLDEAL